MKRYPTLHKVMEIFCNDQGLEAHAFTLQMVQFEPDIDIDKMETELSTLSKEDLETLCIGDADEHPAILEKLRWGGMIHRALDTMFETTGT